MKVETIYNEKRQHRFEHDGFNFGDRYVDQYRQVVTIVGVGVAGMPEVKREDGQTYFADPRGLTKVD